MKLRLYNRLAAALSTLVLASCASVWGFGDLYDVGDGGVDGTTGHGSAADATPTPTPTLDGQGEASPAEATVVPDSSGVPESGGDSSAASPEAGDAGQLPDVVADSGQGDVVGGGCGPTTTILNCSACGQQCDNSKSLSATCEAGATCSYGGCVAGFADCDASPPDTNGCETAVTTTSNCGGCGNACDTVHSTNARCTGTTCTYGGCAPGWADCDTTPPDTNGCETQVSAGSSCGACGQTCDTTHSLGTACDGSTCTYTGCAAGWADCNSTPPNTNGCETDLSLTSSCGACGQACNAQSGQPTCNGTRCNYACNSGRSDCNGASAPDTDGCECTSPGCCGSSCQTIHATGVSAPTVYYDCNPAGHSQSQAQVACAAFATANGGAATSCTSSSVCCGISLGLCVGSPAQSVCASAGGKCYCWQYGGPNPGTVQTVNASSCSAACGSNGDPAWD